MRLVSFRADGAGRIGILRGDRVFDLGKTDPGLPRCMKTLLEMGAEGLRRAAIAAEGAIEAIPSHQVDLLPPVPQPEKIICVGLNYADHAAESGMQPPREPVIFNKLPTAAPRQRRPDRPAGAEPGGRLRGRAGRRHRRRRRAIPRDKALAHVAGYTCGNDVSARDWQKGKPGGQWLLGKSFDSFAPTGPALVTADEVGDPGKLGIKCRLNGRLVQDSCTDQLIFPVAEWIAYVSSVATLKPGDLIFTGTPPGVGMARTPPLYLRAGDLVEVEIERVGLLRNRVAGPPPASSE